MRIIIAILLLTCNSVAAQVCDKYNCFALQQAIKTKEFNRVFDFCQNEGQVFTIVDTNKYFVNCQYDDTCKRKVVISHEWIQEKNRNIVIAIKGEIDKQNFGFCFWCPYNGGAAILYFKKKGKRIKLT